MTMKKSFYYMKNKNNLFDTNDLLFLIKRDSPSSEGLSYNIISQNSKFLGSIFFSDDKENVLIYNNEGLFKCKMKMEKLKTLIY